MPHKRRSRYPGKHPRRFEQRYKELEPEKFPEILGHVRAQGRTPAGTHVPVLVAEVLEQLRPAAGEIVVDCTVGYGGHAAEFLRRIGPTGRLLGFDLDAEELRKTAARLSSIVPGADVRMRHGNFAGIDRALAAEEFAAADVLFADLGVSSMQIDDPQRGFSYKTDGPLDMRMDARLRRTAADLVQTMSEADMAAAFIDLADEPDADAIARAIVRERTRRPIGRTLELASIVLAAKGLSPRSWRKQTGGEGLHPAALVFQTLRILVNDEHSALRQLLRVAPACLAPGGRIGIISFQSGEDRLIKHAFREGCEAGLYTEVSDEVIRPDARERAANPRSAAAKFRWAVRAAKNVGAGETR